VQIDFVWKRRHEEEDDDVDMIPLIDISLVLLIFFMMTAAVSGAGLLFDTPKAENKLLAIDAHMSWVGISRDSDGKLIFSLGQGEQVEGRYDRQEDLLQGLEEHLGKVQEPVNIRIRGDRHLPIEVIQEMTAGIANTN